MNRICDDPLQGQIGVDIKDVQETHDAFGGRATLVLGVCSSEQCRSVRAVVAPRAHGSNVPRPPSGYYPTSTTATVQLYSRQYL